MATYEVRFCCDPERLLGHLTGVPKAVGIPPEWLIAQHDEEGVIRLRLRPLCLGPGTAVAWALPSEDHPLSWWKAVRGFVEATDEARWVDRSNG